MDDKSRKTISFVCMYVLDRPKVNCKTTRPFNQHFKLKTQRNWLRNMNSFDK